MKKLLSLDGWLELVGIKDFRRKLRIRNAFGNAFVNIFVTLIILFVVFIPTYLAIGVWWAVAPTDAIARVILAIGEMVVFGSAQLVFIVLGIIGFCGAFDNKGC